MPSSILAPSVFLTNLRLLLRCEIVDDVKLLADLFGGLAFDHGCDLCTREVQKAFDIKVIRGKYDLEEYLLFNVDILGVPLGNPAFHQIRTLQRLLYLLG